MNKTTMPLIDKRRVVAFCTVHGSQPLVLFVEPKLLQKKKVIQVQPCEACLIDRHRALESLRDKVSNVIEEDIKSARSAVRASMKKVKIDLDKIWSPEDIDSQLSWSKTKERHDMNSDLIQTEILCGYQLCVAPNFSSMVRGMDDKPDSNIRFHYDIKEYVEGGFSIVSTKMDYPSMDVAALAAEKGMEKWLPGKLKDMVNMEKASHEDK